MGGRIGANDRFGWKAGTPYFVIPAEAGIPLPSGVDCFEKVVPVEISGFDQLAANDRNGWKAAISDGSTAQQNPPPDSG